jgi:hypothetical protein
MVQRAAGPRLACSIVIVVALAVAHVSNAQVITGNIYGRVLDDEGAPFPGVAVALTGVGAPFAATTTEGGEFRFLNLSPGEYTVTASLAGFSSAASPKVVVGSKQNADVELTLRGAPRAESVTVMAETPLLDSRRANVGTNVTKLELESIPTARDPWVILQSVAGVQTDRVNIGGSESGQQSLYVGKGSPPAQNAWNLEGIVHHSMAGPAGVGASVLYYDFDAFAEIQVATGGTDPSTQTPGVQINLVTKRGTNDLHGSARVFVTDDRWEATNIPEELDEQLAAGGVGASGNSISGMQDYGAELGGPILADRLWLWGSYGRNEIGLITAGGLTDKTTLETLNVKLNAQPFQSNSATLFYYRSDKVKFGRDAGITRPQETSWDQAGPTNTFKIEDSHVFSENLFATVIGSYNDFGFNLVPEGSGQMRQDSSQVFHNTFWTADYYRPASQVSANASYFHRTGDWGHEIKLGGLYRYNKAVDSNLFEGNVVACNTGASWCGSQTVPAVALNRDHVAHTYLYQYSGYVSDTISLPRLTLNLGLRYDDQRGENAPLSLRGSAAESLVPEGTLLPPALSTPAKDPGYRWRDLQPRVGATYSLDASQKTLVRTSYARYANQLGANSITPYSYAPGLTGVSGAGVVYRWNDVNADNHVDSTEIDTSQILRVYGFDPTNPTNTTTTINGVDPGFEAVKTDEITLSVEREVLPEIAVSVLGTYRKMTDFELSTGFGLGQDDYILSTTSYRRNGLAANPLCPRVGYACGSLPDGAGYEVPVYRVKPGTPLSPGQYTRNNPDYHQTYRGVEVQATKRYSRGWMARLSASYNDWRQHYGEDGFVDPTNVEMYDGGLVVVQSPGSGDKSRVYMNARWQVNVSALYALPLGFSVAGNFFARQGYPLAYFQSVIANRETSFGYERTKSVLVAPYDSYRLPTVSNLDLGIIKSVKVRGLEIKLTADVFNVMNRNTVLQRQSQIGLTGPRGTNTIREIQSPRVVRFGGRVTF